MLLTIVPIVLLGGYALAAAREGPAWPENYGNWCGPGHGGYDDCCGGRPCMACPVYKGCAVPPPDCLANCPPVDAIDAACALHDGCCNVGAWSDQVTNDTRRCGLVPAVTEFCWCNCRLVSNVAAVQCPASSGWACPSYRAALLEYFVNAYCWEYNTSAPVIFPVCATYSKSKCEG